MNKFSIIIAALLLTAGCSTIKPGLPDDAFQAEADAAVVMAFAAAASDTVAPDDSDPDRKVGKCDNCGGTGRSGDGLGRCNICKGDGRIDEEDLATSQKQCVICAGTGRSLGGNGRYMKCWPCDGKGYTSKNTGSNTEPRLLTDQPPSAPAASTLPAAETSPVTIVLHVSQKQASGWERTWWKDDKPYFESLGHAVTFQKEPEAVESWIQVCGKSTCTRVDGHPTRDQIKAIAEKQK